MARLCLPPESPRRVQNCKLHLRKPSFSPRVRSVGLNACVCVRLRPISIHFASVLPCVPHTVPFAKKTGLGVSSALSNDANHVMAAFHLQIAKTVPMLLLHLPMCGRRWNAPKIDFQRRKHRLYSVVKRFWRICCSKDASPLGVARVCGQAKKKLTLFMG